MRNVVFDIMKGIGILAVIVGHLNDVPYMPVRHFCFSFHMPLFFLLAGYFHRNGDTRTVAVKTAKRLLIPYLATSFVMILNSAVKGYLAHDWLEVPKEICAVLFASGGDHQSLYFASFRPIGAIWFLVALFWCKVIYNLLNTHKNSYWIIPIISIAATLTDRYLINLPFAILPGLSALVYYMIGHIVKECSIPKYIYYLAIALYPLSFMFCKIYMVQCYYTCYPLAIVGSCGGVLIIYAISNLVERSNRFLSSGLSWLGRMSLVIMCCHMLEALCRLYTLSGLPTELIIQVPIRIAIPILVAYLCTKFSMTRRIFQIK